MGISEVIVSESSVRVVIVVGGGDWRFFIGLSIFLAVKSEITTD
jgi:hypothetical protein